VLDFFESIEKNSQPSSGQPSAKDTPVFHGIHSDPCAIVPKHKASSVLKRLFRYTDDEDEKFWDAVDSLDHPDATAATPATSTNHS
jgi:hypothetical protein